MSVPNKYKGFSKLPEAVQQKISPELAKKYQMGGSVMGRPLFRQMGGPAEPMPQEMVQQAESEGQMLGEEITQRTVQSIDEATDVEGAINALRGTDLPLDARYQELAGFVGERDAAQTPESVLALTQPAIMMSEQGAMDSGIGELMQSIAGDTQMDQGMDQGLGALMMQGAGNTPPENFNQGGPVAVQYFSPGGVAEKAKTLSQDFLPLYQEIYGGPEQREAERLKDQKALQSQALFDLAGAGLAFAGETEGGSVAERLANALNRTQLTDKIGQRAASMRAIDKAADAEDRAARSAALQAGISQMQTEQAQQAALELKKASIKPDFQKVYGFDKNTQRPTIIGEYNRNDPNANKVLEDLAATTYDGKLFDVERYKTELSLEEKTRGPQDTEPVEVLSPFTVKIGDKEIKFETGDIPFLTDAQKQTHLGKFKPYDANKRLITLYNIDGTGVKTFYEGDPEIKTLIEAGSHTEDRELFAAKNREIEAKAREQRLRSRPEIITEKGQIIELTKNMDGMVTDQKVIGTYAKEDTFGSSLTGRALEFFNSKTKDTDEGKEIPVIDLYAQNKLGEEQTRQMETFITNFTNPEPTVGGVLVKSLPSFVEDAIIKRLEIGLKSPVPLSSLPLSTALQEQFGLRKSLALPVDETGKIDYSDFEDMPTLIVGDVDLSSAQGFASGFYRFGNFFMGQIKDLTGLGPGTAGKRGQITAKATNRLDILANTTIEAARAGIQGKLFALNLKLLEGEVEKFRGAAGKTDAGALSALEAVRDQLANRYNIVAKKLELQRLDPTTYSPKTIEDAKKSEQTLLNLLGEYTAAIMSYKYAASKNIKIGKQSRRRIQDDG